MVSRARGQGPKPGAVRPQRLPTAPAVGIAQARRGMASQSPWPSGHASPDAEGLLVGEARAGSPAAGAGLAHGDQIMSARAGRYPRSTTWPARSRPLPGDTLELNVLRGTGDRTADVSLGESGQLWTRKLELPQAGGKTHLIFCYERRTSWRDVHPSARARRRAEAAAGCRRLASTGPSQGRPPRIHAAGAPGVRAGRLPERYQRLIIVISIFGSKTAPSPGGPRAGRRSCTYQAA